MSPSEVKTFCRTNLDKYKLVQWPDRLVGVPHRGDRVASVDGKTFLAVVAVTHRTGRDGAPYIEVELHYDENMATLARLTAESEKER